MKKLFTILSLMIICISSRAQFPADLAAMRSLNTTQYACSTFHCITPTIEGFQHDTLYGLMNRLYSLVSTSGDLNSVLSIGNQATDQAIILNSATSGTNRITQNNNGISFFNSVGTLQGQLLYASDGTLEIGFKDFSSPWYSFIQTGPLNGLRKVLLPNEGNGIGLGSTLTTHVTKDSIKVINSGKSAGLSYNLISLADGAGNFQYMGYDPITSWPGYITVMPGGYSTKVLPQLISSVNSFGQELYLDNTTNAVGIRTGSGVNMNVASLRDLVSTPGYDTLGELYLENGYFKGSHIVPDNITADRNDTVPNEDGKFAMMGDTVGDPRGNGTLVTKSYLLSSGSTPNFANADLTFTANRNHNAANHSLFIDNLSAVNFQNIGSGGFAINLNAPPDIFLINNIFSGRQILRASAAGVGGQDSLQFYGRYYMPFTDGTNSQIITTDGSGNLSWTSNYVSKFRDLTFTGQTGPRVLAAFTPTVTGQYDISGFVNISSVVTDVLSFQVSWTDDNGVTQTENLPATQGGNITYVFGAVHHYAVGKFTIEAQQGFPVTVSTILVTPGGTVTYSAGAKITK